jgi:hypothetical protein
MTIDGILTSAVGQLLAIGVVAVAYALVKIVQLLNRIRVALRSVHVTVKCDK